MKRTEIKIFLALVLLATGIRAEAQKPIFGYRRKIEVAKEGWYFLALPVDLFRHANENFSDLRIYQFSGSDTLEVPYLLEVQNDQVTEELIRPPVLNKSTRDGKLYVTFELQKGQQANYLDLDFEEENFNGYVSIEGGPDQSLWFELARQQRILSIKNSEVDFTSTTVRFPAANYRYLRIIVQADQKLTLKASSLRDQKIKPGSFTDLNFKWASREDKPAKSTIVEINLQLAQPLGKFSIEADANGADFYRHAVLEALRDSAQTEKGWIYYYDHVWDGYITSLDFNEFSLSQPAKAKKFKLTIQNADSPPLKVKNVRASGTAVHLIARFKPGDNYLYYGNAQVAFPSYDLVHFKNKVVTDSTSLTTGPEEKMVPDPVKGSPLLENKLWLWGVMGMVIGLLGFFTIRMMKNK